MIHEFLHEICIFAILPKCKMPISREMQPETKHNNIAKSGPRWAFCNVSLVKSATIAVGPTGTSFQEPKIVYTKQAIKDE